MTRLFLSALLLLASVPARALLADPGDGELVPMRQRVPQAAPHPKDETPKALRWMLAPLDRGMFVRLPIVDSDPNRGVTYGVMPIIVLQGKNDERIEQIHAPSLTYNKIFKLSPTYRYYYYPQEDASFMARASRAKYEHETMLQYEDHSFWGTNYDVFGRAQEAADSGQHFFGLGPDSPKSAETNYKQQYWLVRWAVGVPFAAEGHARVRVSQRYQTSRLTNGPTPGLPGFDATFPAQFSERAQQTNETRLSLEYDTRDHTVTTSRGLFGNVFAEKAIRGYLSAYEYDRTGIDLRAFRPLEKHPDHVLAAQLYYEQVLGPTPPPFWLLPSLGGKYSLRAYGEGRYVERGVAAVNVEERFKVYEARASGVTTEIQVAPFAGVGEAFEHPGRAGVRYARPVVGTAFRAVAKPQVVGSVDVGIGREGVSIFTDINYSF